MLAMADEYLDSLFDATRRARLAQLADLAEPLQVASSDTDAARRALHEAEVLITCWGCPPLTAGVSGWALHRYPLWFCRMAGDAALDGLRDRFRRRLHAYLDDAQHLVSPTGGPLYQGRSLTAPAATGEPGAAHRRIAAPGNRAICVAPTSG